MNPHLPCFFEIPVNDLDRAMAFYSALFGFRLERTVVDGNAMAFFPARSPEATGSAGTMPGALSQGDSYKPSQHGTRIYFETPDIEATLAKATSLGVKVVYPKTDIGEWGYVAEILDSEGNCIALHSPK